MPYLFILRGIWTFFAGSILDGIWIGFIGWYLLYPHVRDTAQPGP